MPDQVTNLGNAVIQHGPENDRVYLMKMDPADAEKTLTDVETLAKREGYSKIFAKVPAEARKIFRARGYTEEACIPRYYHGHNDLHFMSRFLHKTRAVDAEREQTRDILQLAQGKAVHGNRIKPLPETCQFRVCAETDIPDIVKIYQTVFESYPFPIHDPDYIAETMRTHVTYFGIWEDGSLLALSSAERDLAADSVEMTDFATLPPARGRGFGVHLLQEMEKEMRRQSVHTAYTIARAISPGMNIVFAKQGYNYGGTLINNTDICGHLESMNIWWKPL